MDATNIPITEDEMDVVDQEDTSDSWFDEMLRVTTTIKERPADTLSTRGALAHACAAALTLAGPKDAASEQAIVGALSDLAQGAMEPEAGTPQAKEPIAAAPAPPAPATPVTPAVPGQRTAPDAIMAPAVPTARAGPAKPISAAAQGNPRTSGARPAGATPQPRRPTLERACYSCGETGHRYSDCPHGPPTSTFCRRCGRKGKTLATCPSCSQGWRQRGPYVPRAGRNVPREELKALRSERPRSRRPRGPKASLGGPPKPPAIGSVRGTNGDRACPKP
ncbi:uncharacterized protein LOC112493806 [Cephus cinctus]|uniref:Uncharacterized protein LOC112493806 n=1 Tax=Cephus cinctus TaxID=211228 RepID=A0AAJ7R9S3_CEPCN|nr:uncharacterized protein LOC112493806 [Cephus cinctus]